jgi:hypothetical protein
MRCRREDGRAWKRAQQLHRMREACIYLMLSNHKVRDVIDTITSKAVLILGRFTQERKPVLEALRKELRQRKYLPILFDFEKPRSRNTDETITLLARMARFVVADISDAKSVLQELRAIVPDLPSVPVQPIKLLTWQRDPITSTSAAPRCKKVAVGSKRPVFPLVSRRIHAIKNCAEWADSRSRAP